MSFKSFLPRCKPTLPLRMKYDGVLIWGGIMLSLSHSIVSYSHGLKPARLLCPWNFPGMNTRVGSHSQTVKKFLVLEDKEDFQRLFLKLSFSSIQFSSVAQSCPTLCDPMNRSTPGLPVHHQLPEFMQTHVHRVGNAIQPSHPLSAPSPSAPNPYVKSWLFGKLSFSSV